jgi:MFS family permease
MTYTKRIKIIEYFIVALYIGYLWTSLFALIIQIDSYGFSSEANFWFFNLFIAAILWFPFIIIHEIIKKYSIQQILENIKWHNLRKIKLFKIMIIIGLGLLLIPITIVVFSSFLIPSMKIDPFGFVIIPAIIGLCFFIIGICMNSMNKEMDNKQRPSTASSLPVPISKPKESRIENAYIGFFVLNWIGLIPLSALIFRFLLKMSWLLITIIVIIWALLTIFFLIYIERKK